MFLNRRVFKTFNEKTFEWVNCNYPWTNVYGLSRSLMALATALTLIFNDASVFFRPASGIDTYPYCPKTIPSVFCLTSNDYFHLNIVRWICVLLLLIIATGWRPRITGVIHWWICYSLQVSALTIDGGEQVNAVFTLLLLPITLTDSRKWHWYNNEVNNIDSNGEFYARIIALVSFVAIRVQVSILYFNSFIAKLGEEDWINGTAVYYYSQHLMLGFPEPILHILQFIITSKFVVVATWGTLLIQFLLFAAIIAPKKGWNLLFYIGLLMHDIFAIMFGLISFSMIMCSILILYLRPLDKPFKLKKLNLKRGLPERGDKQKALNY
ncbi:sporulation-delaying protein SdpB family protein [Bacillus atrophaeus]|uniref:sporulation-delaying protein SdpB family protein n=1 Tax=Bacillus atrophaeus TaxID=1452 RepID=UPI00240CF1AE|nr:sporulation-delaying protein SdpB family protein [Bacillus atrophaeus]